MPGPVNRYPQRCLVLSPRLPGSSSLSFCRGPVRQGPVGLKRQRPPVDRQTWRWPRYAGGGGAGVQWRGWGQAQRCSRVFTTAALRLHARGNRVFTTAANTVLRHGDRWGVMQQQKLLPNRSFEPDASTELTVELLPIGHTSRSLGAPELL